MTIPKNIVIICELKRVLTRLIIQSPKAFVQPIILTKAVIIPSTNPNNKIYTFPLFNPLSSTKTNLNDFHISENDSGKLKLAIKKAEAIMPTPRDNKTLLVTSTIIMASIGGTNDQIVLSIHKDLLRIYFINLKNSFT